MKAKQAARRRRVLTRYAAEDRERLIKEQAQSGMTKKAFCGERGINLGTFHGWGQRPRRSLMRKPTFAEVEVRGYAQAAVFPTAPAWASGMRASGTIWSRW